MKPLWFFLASCLFGAFVFFSFLVSKELFVQFDFDTTVRLQNHIPRSFDLPFSLISLFGNFEITALFWLGFVFLALIKRWWKAFFLSALFPFSQTFEIFGKLFLLHPSPPFLFYRGALPFDFPTVHIQTDYSYPSGHTIRLTFLGVLVFFYITSRTHGFVRFFLQGMLVAFLFVVFVSRVYLGEHWTTDVIGGALLGTSFGILVGIAIPSKKRSGKRNDHSLNQGVGESNRLAREFASRS